MTRKQRQTLLPYGKQWIDGSDIEAVVEVLRGDWITQGPAIERFERAVADYVGARYAVAFCNGTAALHGACFAAGIGQGDEVITTPITFLASSNCVLYMGGKPIFADIDPITYNIDPEQIAIRITDRTKAIVAVDFTGQPVNMERIGSLARDHNLTIIHDAAHSFGASFSGRKVGTFGDMTMFSFHPVKHVTTGEGGVIVTDREELWERLLLFRNHGMTRDPKLLQNSDGPWYYEMQLLGYNYRMTDMQAALGASQIKKLDQFVERRRNIARQYTEAFTGVSGLIVPSQHPFANSSWHLYVLRWEKGRDRAFEELRSRNIGVNLHYIPVYKQPFYRNLGYEEDQCQVAERFYKTALSLPLFPRMSNDDVEYVIEEVLEVAKSINES